MAQDPPAAREVQGIIEKRLAARGESGGEQESVTIDWRGERLTIPVVSMPIGMLTYNPDTHRIRAQRTLDAARDRVLTDDPYGRDAQRYLHQLLMGDPTDPSKVDPAFVALKDDLAEHGQNEPGIISRSGVLINGNTRRAALSELGTENIRVGVLPSDAGSADIETVELSLQLRKNLLRNYSFMNFLLAIDERVQLGRPQSEILSTFRITMKTLERSRWILSFIQDAMTRSHVQLDDGSVTQLRLIDFEKDQGKLEELWRAYHALKPASPDEAEALREQRLLAIALDKSKTDLRLIEPDFAERHLDGLITASPAAPAVTIPGTSIVAPGPSSKVSALRDLATSVLQARAVQHAPDLAGTRAQLEAANRLAQVNSVLDKGLDQAGKNARIMKRRTAAVDRLTDPNDQIVQALEADATARASGNFDPEDLDDELRRLRTQLSKLARSVARGDGADAEGAAWLRTVAALETGD